MKKMFAGCIAVVVLALALVVTFGVAALGQVAIRQMHFDDGTEGWVPLANVQAAIKDGGQFGPKPVPQTYLEKTAAGPFQPAGQAEKTMGEQFGNNAAQAKEAAKDVAVGAIATLAGTLGAPWLAATFKALLPAALLSGMRLR